MTNIEPHDPAGAGNSGPGGRLESDRPTYPVAKLIIDVQRVLREAGVVISIDPNTLYTASIAGCDLLRAMGVVPIAASADARQDPRRQS